MTAAAALAQDEGSATQAPAPKPTNVYTSQLGESIKVGVWSNARTGKGKDGEAFLGPYGWRDTLYQTLPKLPEHRFVRVRFDLLIAKSWDGPGKGVESDTWFMMVKGGPTLMRTSFCNMRDKNAAGEGVPDLQSYPDEFRFATHPAGTGASGKGAQLLPQRHNEGGPTSDSIYKMDLFFPHTSKDLVLQYTGNLDDGKDDEAWCLRNVIVDTIDHPSQQTEQQLKSLWEQIKGKDPVAANQAFWKIMAAGPAAGTFIEKSWSAFDRGKQDGKPIDKAIQARFDAIVPNLAANSFVERQKAQKELQALGIESIDLAIKHKNKSNDPETRKALSTAITQLRRKFATGDAQLHKEIVRSRVDHMLRIFETSANGYKISSSVNATEFPHDPIGAPADGIVPQSSGIQCSPRFTWYPKRGSEEWLQYEFPKAKTISTAEVFWFTPHHVPVHPKSWKVVYQTDDGTWKPVENKEAYTLEPDKMNKVTFKPVKTSAVRLVVQLPDAITGGVHEFRVSEGKNSN